MDRFFVRKDPTLLFGGIKSPWDDYMSTLSIRLDTQLVTTSPIDPEWDAFTDSYVSKLATGLDLSPDMQDTMGLLLMEFKHLRPSSPTSTGPVAPGTVLPYYHDNVSTG